MHFHWLVLGSTPSCHLTFFINTCCEPKRPSLFASRKTRTSLSTMMRITTTALLSASLLLAGPNSNDAFTTSTNRLRNRPSAFASSRKHSLHKIQQTPAVHRTAPSMYIDDEHVLDSASHLMSMSFAMPISAISMTASTVISDPTVEAELFNDIAHVGLDLVTFLGPATAILRLAALIGRLAAIGADYVPDHTMLPSELLFQCFMLYFASQAFLRSFLPIILASTAKTDFSDGRAYRKVFEKVGLTWMQYKAIKSYAMEWITVEPNVCITSDEHNSSTAAEQDYVYVLYRGDVQVTSAGQSLMNLTQGLLGERHLSKSLERSSKNKSKNSSNGEAVSSSSSYPKTTICAGDKGATLLRIQTSKLTTLMDHDPELAQSIRSLLMKGMEEKLNTLLTTRNSPGAA